MITKKENTKQRQFKGVSFEVLAVGEKSMLTKMNYKIDNNVPKHSHPNEQNGYVVSGEYMIEYGDVKEIIKQGDSYSISENIEHSLVVIKAGEVIDVFTPPREDYL